MGRERDGLVSEAVFDRQPRPAALAASVRWIRRLCSHDPHASEEVVHHRVIPATARGDAQQPTEHLAVTVAAMRYVVKHKAMIFVCAHVIKRSRCQAQPLVKLNPERVVVGVRASKRKQNVQTPAES
jgi:hypothetical protein